MVKVISLDINFEKTCHIGFSERETLREGIKCFELRYEFHESCDTDNTDFLFFILINFFFCPKKIGIAALHLSLAFVKFGTYSEEDCDAYYSRNVI